MTRSATSSFARKIPACLSIWSTRVVFPWSTWAMTATFLICMLPSSRTGAGPEMNPNQSL